MNHHLNKHRLELAITAVLLASFNAFAANAAVTSLPLSAERIGLQLQQYQAQGAGPFSADAGQALWLQQSEDRSCTSCHTAKATAQGIHQNTQKPIEAMAPSMTNNRLTDAAKIEKWFSRNCNWTFKRECTPQEKGDALLWLSLQ
ncbi:DUF1924 domain-containing protein [Shewanella oneidensis MR-1]|uniref:Monoheme cytochrome c Shp n=1 Tax=Shewanella oneidensis (strain ATCC 700550 / JCM 31522 / CIP 106686 / LMG 19005 / NCIMB 14063 / MR-1) TaxID=211586 RepID=Q8E911_SHEON|nr:DUF1924 domain-containing protein [Shewanella oneidensis]AAN57449.1 monoheme cytochrome c Shp [Shewanella oneidensis MR-1]MDX5998253.1 DUF1924 domain-containing protein [Shewanella oneidensis]MEE2029028.1 hypothetical protein [Shewanella oneidensis]QKG94765.1 DUF1924 domain-containing protein [Shewanella oneidensis MR-1]